MIQGEVALAQPRMRHLPEDLNDCLDFFIESASQTMGSDELIAEVQRAEQLIREKKRRAGIDFLGCGSSQSGEIEDGRREHLVEHAICSVLDNNVPPDEQSSGYDLTLRVRSCDSSWKIIHQIIIVPPPSMPLSEAERLKDITLKEIASFETQKTRELDLLSIS